MLAPKTATCHAAEEKLIFAGFLLFHVLTTILLSAALALNWQNPELAPHLFLATVFILAMDLQLPLYYFRHRHDLAKAKDREELDQGAAQAPRAQYPSRTGISEYLR